jgi:hypothetical protein
MAIPTPAFTSGDVATECSLTPPWAHNAASLLAILADGAVPYTSADLAGRSSSDYIPDAIGWGAIGSHTADDTGFAYADTSRETLTGVNPSISMTVDTTDAEINCTGSVPNANYTLDAYVNGSLVGSVTWSRSGGGQTLGLSRSMTFNVPNNATVLFSSTLGIGGFGNATGGASATFNVKNASNGNAVLDTFTMATSATYAPG